MEEIDRLLKQWIPVNTIIREEIRNAIVKHKMESMDRAFAAGRNAERIPERMLERVRELSEADWRIWRERQIQRHRDGLKDARGDLDLVAARIASQAC